VLTILPFVSVVAVVIISGLVFVWLAGAVLVAALRWRRENRRRRRPQPFPARVALFPQWRVPTRRLRLILVGSAAVAVLGGIILIVDWQADNPTIAVSKITPSDTPSKSRILFRVYCKNFSSELAATRIRSAMKMRLNGRQGTIEPNGAPLHAMLLPHAETQCGEAGLEGGAWYQDLHSGKQKLRLEMALRYRVSGWDYLYTHDGEYQPESRAFRIVSQDTRRLGWRPWDRDQASLLAEHLK
jgi:hypothetical protein